MKKIENHRRLEKLPAKIIVITLFFSFSLYIYANVNVDIYIIIIIIATIGNAFDPFWNYLEYFLLFFIFFFEWNAVIRRMNLIDARLLKFSSKLRQIDTFSGKKEVVISTKINPAISTRGREREKKHFYRRISGIKRADQINCILFPSSSC